MIPFFFIVVAVCFLWLPVTDIDIWWHLKTGEFIWQTGQIPFYDIFSYTAQGKEWFNHEWLYGVLYYLLHAQFGNQGIILVRWIFGFLTLALLYQINQRLSQERWASLAGAVLSFYVVSIRFTDRPAMWTTFFICLVFYIVTAVQTGRLSKKATLWFLLIFPLWANLHAGVLLGLLLLFLLWLPGKLTLPPPLEGGGGGRGRFLLFGAILTTTLINPRGWRLLTFPFENLNLTVARATTMEWMGAFQGSALSFVEGKGLLILYLVVGICFLISRPGPGRPKLSWGYTLSLFLTAVMATKALRFVAEFASLASPLFALSFRNLTSRFKLSPVTARIAPLLTLTVLVLVNVPKESLKSIEAKIAASAVPHYTPDLMVFLNQNQIHGHVFNDINLGPSFIYFRWPGEKVFVDTRHSVYGDPFLLDYRMAAQDPGFFEAFSAPFGGFDYALLEYWSYAPSVSLHQYFWAHPDWHLVYYSNKGFIYLKNVRKFKAVIKKFGLREPPPLLKNMVPLLKSKK